MSKYATNHAYITLRCALADQRDGLEVILRELDGHAYTLLEKWLSRELHSRREKADKALKRADRELEEARKAA